MAIFLGTLFVIVCILLIIVVLLQKGRGGGLGAAFGGAGSSAFGTRTGDVFTWVTIVLTALFLLLAIGTTMYYHPPKQTTAAPMAYPGEMAIDANVSVSLNSRTRDAKIFYTLDGSDPTKESISYDDVAFIVKPGTTLKARAYGVGMNPSAVMTAYYGRPKAATTQATGPSAESLPTASSAPAAASAPAAK